MVPTVGGERDVGNVGFTEVVPTAGGEMDVVNLVQRRVHRSGTDSRRGEGCC